MRSPDFSAACPDCGATVESHLAGDRGSQTEGEQLPVPGPEAERATCPACGLKLGRVDDAWVPDEDARPE